MPLENANSIAELNENWPLGTDPMGQGDDHIRLMKRLLKSGVEARLSSLEIVCPIGAPNVQEYMTSEQRADSLLDKPLLDHSSAFQSAVARARELKTNTIYVPTSLGQNYRIDTTVVIDGTFSGFAIVSDSMPKYQGFAATEPEYNGYITGAANPFFNYGTDNTTASSNQVVLYRCMFYQPFGTTSTAFAFRQNNNGPHRGFRAVECSATGFSDVFTFEAATPTNLSVASVVIEGGCYRSNVNVANALTRGFGLRVVGNQAEQGAKFVGEWDGPITIADNMLEGQNNVLNFDSNAPQVDVRQNYAELIMGDYFCRVRGTNKLATVNLGMQYLSRIEAVDVYRVEGIATVIESNDLSQSNTWNSLTRKSLLTLTDCIAAPRSVLTGDYYTGTTTTTGAKGYCDPTRINNQPPSNHDSTFMIGTVGQSLASGSISGPFEVTTPVGIFPKAAQYTGYPAVYKTLDVSYAAGDMVVACALVKGGPGFAPRMSTFNEAFTDTGVGMAGLTISEAESDKWYLMFASEASSVAGAELNVRFGSNDVAATGGGLQVACIGAYVIPQADFKALGTQAESRAFIQLFNPSQYSDTEDYAASVSEVGIAAGSNHQQQYVINGARLGDVWEHSYTQSTAGLLVATEVRLDNIVRTTFYNVSGSPVTLPAGTLTQKLRR